MVPARALIPLPRPGTMPSVSLPSVARRLASPLVASVLLLSSPDARADDPGEPLTLEEAIALALRQAPDMVRARADVVLVDVERTRAVATVLPRVDLALGVSDTYHGNPILEVPNLPNAVCNPAMNPVCPPGTVPPSDPRAQVPGTRVARFDGFLDTRVLDGFHLPQFRGTLSVRQLLYDGGRWWTAIDRVGDLETQRKAVLRQVENNLRLKVTRELYELESSRQAVETFRVQMRFTEAQLERARERLAQGRGTEADVAAAERNLAQDRLTRARLEFSVARHERSFNLALGRAPDTPARIVIPSEVVTATAALGALWLPTVDEAMAAALDHRPDLVISRSGLAMLKKNVAIQAADYLPSVTAGASYTRFSRRPDRTFHHNWLDNYYAGVDLQVRWNLFEGGRTDAAVQEAQVVLVKATADYENLERMVLSEVQDRLQNLALQIQVYELARSSVGSASQAARLARELFANDGATALELRDAEIKFVQARLGAINARLEVEMAREELRRAIGADILAAAPGP